jgi:ribosomal protein L7/L12
MQTLMLAGWRAGLQKVELAKLQQELLHLSLKEAKENVDRLLEAEMDILPVSPVVLQVPDEVAAEFSSRADELGAFIGFVSFSTTLKAPLPRPAKLAIANPQQAA